jgi:hypothetical protein
MSVPIYDFACANEKLFNINMEQYYSCCGKSICGGCSQSGNLGKCPFCKAEIIDKTEGEKVEELKKRVEANDAGAICWVIIIITVDKVFGRIRQRQ